jgi:hypothetical protein
MGEVVFLASDKKAFILFEQVGVSCMMDNGEDGEITASVHGDGGDDSGWLLDDSGGY